MNTVLMKPYRLLSVILLSVVSAASFAQRPEGGSTPVEVDYEHPKSYIVGGISVEGNTHFGEQQIISLTGLQEGMKVTVPSDELSSVIARLWAQR